MTDCTNPECAQVRAELAELKRPRTPAEFGLDVYFSPIEKAILCALLPPGRVTPTVDIWRRVWPADEAAGLGHRMHHLCRVHIARVRTRLLRAGSAWRVPYGNNHGDHVLLAPDMPLPPGFREAGTWRAGASHDVRVPCPGCDGSKSADARRCVGCDRRARATAAAARRRVPSACPDCGGEKMGRAARCWSCYTAWLRADGRPKSPPPLCVDCKAPVSKRIHKRCAACFRAARRGFTYWMAS